MQILSRSVYLGPNLYALFPVIRLTVDLGALEDWPSGRLGPTFTEPLLERLPGLHEHGCSYGVPGGFVRRLREGEGTWMGHILEHVAIELQNVAGAQVTFGKTRGNGVYGQYDVVYQYEQNEIGLEAGELALRLLLDLVPAELRPGSSADDRQPGMDADDRQPGADDRQPGMDAAQSDGGSLGTGAAQTGAEPPDEALAFDFAAERDAFIRFAQSRALGPSTAALVRAAEAREIPWLRLNRYSLIQLGHGRYGKRIQATVTSETRHIAVEVASDKEETNRILADLGLPVPRQQLVYTPDEAMRAAARIGFPVVVKPLDANHGRGVSINLHAPDDVAVAFEHAREHARTVIVESYITGLDHRLVVVDGQLVAAAKRVPGHVVGDGVHTVAELVDIANQDPRRGIGHEKVLTRLEFDHQAERLLGQRGYARDTVPPADEVVYLRSTGNLSTGGTAIDVTDVVHPDVREMAIRAARAIGLDVAGVDYLTSDISKSYGETGGAICEVNAAPGFRMHVAPSEGKPRDVAGPVMDMLFPPGTPSRIPIAAITGTNGKTTTTRMVAHIFKLAGHRVGVATTDGVLIDGHLTVSGDMTGPMAARMVLRDPSVDVAVLETARGGLLRSGMGYSRCTVGAVINVQADHLGLGGVHTLAQLAKVKRIVVEVARDTAVLNADDAECLKMADHTRAAHLCYVTLNHRHPLVAEHIREGGRAVVLEEGMNGHMLALYDGGSHIPLLWTHLIPATMEGRAMFNVQNAMFAAGIAYSMGVPLEDIRHGLRTFDTTYFQAPGRLNVFDEHPFKVILDYGHNPHAVKAMVQLVERLEPKGRRIVVLAAPGDRRDEDIREIATLCAGHFDAYICRRDDHPRGRAPDEVPMMQAAALAEAGVDVAKVQIVPDEQEAVDAALRLARKDDLVLIFGDKIDRCWNQIIHFAPDDEQPRHSEMASPALPYEPDDVPAIARQAAASLVRDERGVRLAKEKEEAD